MLEPLERSLNGRRLGLKNFDPCTVVLNNDLASGVPGLLENIHEQTLLPPLHAGWAVRRKSTHMSSYDDVVKRFAKMVDIDPWMLNPFYLKCNDVSFDDTGSETAVMAAVDSILAKIRKKYREYGIKDKPFAVVKADADNVGVNLMLVKHSSELPALLRQQTAIKHIDLIVQEGIYSFEQINQSLAEPVVYMIDRYVVGGFYKVHEQGMATENGTEPATQIVPLAFAQQHAVPDMRAKPGTAAPNRFYLYGVVARLALLAASLELEKTDPNPEIY
jgi:glutamate--cysteine ligase